MSPLTAALSLGLALVSAPAEASHPTRATLTVDNELRMPLYVYVDGDYVGRVPGRVQLDLSVMPGTHGVRLVQAGQSCVLSADIVDLPRGSTVYYQVDRPCTPVSWSGRWHGGFEARWDNTWVSWRPGPRIAVVHDPYAVRIHEHHGMGRAPVVRHQGYRVAERSVPSDRGGRPAYRYGVRDRDDDHSSDRKDHGRYDGRYDGRSRDDRGHHDDDHRSDRSNGHDRGGSHNRGR